MSSYEKNPKQYWEDRHQREGDKYVGAGNSQTVCDEQEEVFWGILKPYFESPRQCSTVLDFGCGTGRFSRYLVAADVSYAGVDLNGIAINKLAALFKENEKAQFFELNPYTALPFESESFDIIQAITVLQHVVGDHYDHWSSELARVAKRDSIFLIVDDANPANQKPAKHMQFRKPEDIAESLGARITKKQLLSAEKENSHWFFVAEKYR